MIFIWLSFLFFFHEWNVECKVPTRHNLNRESPFRVSSHTVSGRGVRGLLVHQHLRTVDLRRSLRARSGGAGRAAAGLVGGPGLRVRAPGGQARTGVGGAGRRAEARQAHRLHRLPGEVKRELFGRNRGCNEIVFPKVNL